MTGRAAARVAGALFIAATVASTLAVLLLQHVVGAPDYLTRASLSETRMATGILLELINHIAVVGIAVVIYPVLRRFSERLAVGYVAARSIEAVLFAVGTMHLLALPPLPTSRPWTAYCLLGTTGTMRPWLSRHSAWVPSY